MSTTQIPRTAWTAALNEFSSLHEGWIISLDVWTPEMGALTELHHLPLVGVSTDRHAPEGVITISAGNSPAEHISHSIHGAIQISIERQPDGVTAALHVESSGGVKTSMRFERGQVGG